MDARLYWSLVAGSALAGWALGAWAHGAWWAGLDGAFAGLLIGVLALAAVAWCWERRPWKRREPTLTEHMDSQWRAYLRRKFDEEIAAERAKDRSAREAAD